MNPQIASVFSLFLYLLIIAVVARSLMSWFPNAQGSALARALDRVTEPLIAPVRRVVPRMGMIDLSPMIVIIALTVVQSLIGRAATT